MKINSLFTAGVLGALTLLTGCGGGGGSGGGLGGGGGGVGATGGRLRVHITDAPFPFDYVESATVVINEVQVHEKNSDAWTTVFTGAATIDLVPLQNGLTQLLVDAEIEPGTYDQVRLLVDAGEVVLTEEAVVEDDHVFNTEGGDLKFPSGAQTGIKLHIENDIVVTTELSGDLILDFDLSRNFVFNGPVTHAPGVKRVIFTPSVRATNASVAGSLQVTALSDNLTPGEVSDDTPLAGATVSVFDATADPLVDAPIATGATDADGIALIAGLPPGEYQAVVEAAGHESATVGGITIVIANLTSVEVTLAATGQITGNVMSDAGTPASAADDVPVEGATVEVRAADDPTVIATTSTDSSGTFQVIDLPAGNYDVTVTATGFVTQTVEDVPATLTGGPSILLVALTSNVTGTLTDTGTGTGIAAASVVVTNASGQVAATTTADDGTYSLVLGTGSYTVTFTSGAATVGMPLVIVGEDPPNNVTLDASLTL